MSPSHHDLNDNEFLRQLADCSLNPSYFSHEAHIRLAWLHIHQYGKAQAQKNICKQIKAYADFLGVQLYHHTVTMMAVTAVADYIEKDSQLTKPATSFTNFITSYPDLTQDFKSVINSYYHIDIFQHPTAKTEYIAPEFLAPKAH